MVYFSDERGSVRCLARERLPGHEAVYAMTIHKSQGSEYDHVLIVLPDRESPVLTRELIYTGLTRARKNITILANESIIESAVKTHADIVSGLCDLIVAAK